MKHDDTIVLGLLLVHMRTCKCIPLCTLAKCDFTAVWDKSVTSSVCLRTYSTSTQT